MADFNFGVTKINGHVGGGEFLTLTMDFWTVTTAVNILTANDVSGTGSATTQAALDKLVEVIALNGQPVILAAPTVSGSTYTFKFAIEHQGSWGLDGSKMVAAIKAAGINYAFGADTTLTATLATHL